MPIPQTWTYPETIHAASWNDVRLYNPASYIFFVENSLYYAYGQSSGLTDYSGSNASSVMQSVVSTLKSGGNIFIKEGYYPFDTSIVFPFGARSITIQGSSGWGKSDTHSGTFLESTITSDALFKTSPTTDLRSAFGLKFENLIVLGPKTVNSTGFSLNNTDTFEFSSCAIHGFHTSLNVTYIGTTLSEQPGMGFIHDCIWAEGATGSSEFLYFDKCTEVTISNCVFGWENFTRAILLRDCNKIRIGPNNEFNIGVSPSPITEYIYISSSYGTPFTPNQIDIHDNWAYCENATNKWIRIIDSTAVNVWGIKSVDNTIHHGYTPDLFVNCPYVVADWTNLVAHDITYPPCHPSTNLRDLTVTCPIAATYQNKWPPVSLYFQFNVSSANNVFIKMSKDNVTWATVYFTDVSGSSTNTNLVVPTLWYWRVDTTGSTQTGLWGIYG